MLAPTVPGTTADWLSGRKRLLRRVLRSDPSQEYLVYVPQTAVRHGPLFVSIHGVSRNADQHARLLAAYADIYGTVLVAPIFAPEPYADYQRLGRLGRGKRADIALNMVVADAAAMTGAAGEKFYLFGFSGGAQFAHRYLMANPHRVAAAVIAASGWYTFPDPTRRFPYGTRMSRKLPDVRFDAEEFLSVPVTVMVGAGDDAPTAVRRKDRLDREQGVNRVERARRWVAAMHAAAAMHHMESRVAYEEIENCDHSFRRSILRGGLGDRVFRALFGEPPSRTAGG
jgi:poly(3-hydroxybutyrate) depolymerase